MALPGAGIQSFVDQSGGTHGMILAWGNAHRPPDTRQGRNRHVMRFLLTVLGSLFVACPASAIVDVNNNGLSDLWEMQYNQGELFPEIFDPKGDSDSDGWTNADEAAAGTNPFDANKWGQ